MYNRTNGFESIAELLNILRLGHLRVVATKEIGPSTEIVMDHVHVGSAPTCLLFQHTWYSVLNCIVCIRVFGI